MGAEDNKEEGLGTAAKNPIMMYIPFTKDKQKLGPDKIYIKKGGKRRREWFLLHHVVYISRQSGSSASFPLFVSFPRPENA